MFLAGEQPNLREQKLRDYFYRDPSIGLLIAAVHFEWSVCRAIMFLSPNPNRDVRERMGTVYGLEHYKQLWRDEVSVYCGGIRLPKVVGNWQQVKDAFRMRNLLIHGRDRVTRKMAESKFEALIRGAEAIREYCLHHGINFQDRIPIRKRKRTV